MREYIVLFVFLFYLPFPAYGKTKVGLILPGEGPMSSPTCIIKNVVNEDLIDLNTYNNGNSIVGVIDSTQKAIKDNVEVFIGPRTSSEAIALLKTIGRNSKYEVIVPMASHDKITNDYSYTHRLIPSISESGEKMANFISEKVDPNGTVSIFKNLSLPYSLSYASIVKKALKQKNINVSEYEIIDGDIETLDIILKKQPRNVNFYLPLYTTQSIKIIQALVGLDKTVNVFAQGGLVDGVNKIKSILRGNEKVKIYFNNIWSGKVDGKLKSIYLNAARKCKVEPFEFRSLIAFDAIKLLEAKILLRKSKGFNIGYRGLLGKYVFNEKRNRNTYIYVREISYGVDTIHAR